MNVCATQPPILRSKVPVWAEKSKNTHALFSISQTKSKPNITDMYIQAFSTSNQQYSGGMDLVGPPLQNERKAPAMSFATKSSQSSSQDCSEYRQQLNVSHAQDNSDRKTVQLTVP